MKREHKCRGQRVDDGKWVYGFYAEDATSTTVYILTHDGVEFTGDYCYNEVDPETVGELTGVNDVEGIEIWEGDILDNNVTRWIVVFESGCFCAKPVGGLTPSNYGGPNIALRALKGAVKRGNSRIIKAS